MLVCLHDANSRGVRYNLTRFGSFESGEYIQIGKHLIPFNFKVHSMFKRLIWYCTIQFAATSNQLVFPCSFYISPKEIFLYLKIYIGQFRTCNTMQHFLHLSTSQAIQFSNSLRGWYEIILNLVTNIAWFLFSFLIRDIILLMIKTASKTYLKPFKSHRSSSKFLSHI